MINVFIFHGTGGSPAGNWFPWLKGKLEKKECLVFVPQFPDPRENHNLEDWLKVLQKYEQHIDERSILVGHSLGGLFLLRVLERLNHPVAAAFFVATPVGVKPIRYYDSDEKFSGFKFEWGKIKGNANNFFVYHSNNDPYVSLGNGELLAKQLGVQLTMVPNAGHLNAESGHTKFDRLLKDINGILGKQQDL
ncbi:MAG TPA: alpha/beta fold hydrolase [Candidatus Nanoarchaeia archaeon]|nr:alpha/beta fold hydrolase [Candidatus Nanoarchaeia archaeon]